MTITALIGLLCFLVGVLCGVVTRDALNLFRQSRKERAMRPPCKMKHNVRTLLSVLLAVTVVVNLGLSVLLITTRLTYERVELENRDNAVTSCQNANDSREAQRTLWAFVLQASAANNKDKTPEQRETAKKFGEWVDKLFADRDCTDLSKRYPLPPPPKLGS